MKIFVTGGSGFIGGHLIERLATEHEVRALARSDAAARTVERFGAKPVLGDLATLAPEHVAGADAVVHAAAWVKSYGRRADFEAANVVGTSRALDAARTAGVRRFVHIGTEAALFDGHDLLDVDETAAYPERQRFLYSETKAEAERRVLAANAPGFTTLSLRPRLVWGPRDAAVLPEVLEAVERGAFAWIDGGRQLTSTTYVENLADAVATALVRGRGGEAYFVADEGTRTMRAFLTALTATRGVALPERSVPGWVARPLANVVESAFAVVAPSKKPPMVSFAVSMLSRSVTVRTDKAKVELGWRAPFSVDEGLARTQEARA